VLCPCRALDSQAQGRTGVGGPGLSRRQRALYGLGMVFARYGWTRLSRLAAARHWGDLPLGSAGNAAWRAMRAAEKAHKLATLANFLAFLLDGKYRCAAGAGREEGRALGSGGGVGSHATV
jgi:Pex2 / Pex12 amino terminal region